MLDIEAVLGFIVSIGVALVLGFLGYTLGRKFIGDGAVDEEVQGVARMLLGPVGVLMGLMLSITFVNARQMHQRVQTSAEFEAAQLTDLVHDLERYEGGESIRLLVDAYVDSVLKVEWPELAKGRLSKETGLLFRQLEDTVLALQPPDRLHEELRARMLTDIDEISDYRQTRLFLGGAPRTWFLIVITLAFLATMFLLAVYRPRMWTWWFIVMYSLLIGVAVSSILDMNRPFGGLTTISPEPYRAIYLGTASEDDSLPSE